MTTESVPFYRSPLFYVSLIALGLAAYALAPAGDPLLNRMDAINADNASNAEGHYKWLDMFGYEK